MGTIHGYARSSQPPKSLRRHPERAAESWLGIESQRRAIIERFPDAVIHADAAKSGRNGRRPGLRAMMEAIQPGDVVCVVRLDRLARDSRLALALELEIEATRGCRLYSLAGEGTSLDGPPDPVLVFQRRMAMATAELQAGQAAQATAAAFRVRREQGLTCNGSAPFGWRVGEGGRIEPDDTEQRVVAEVLAFTRGRLWNASGAELAERLNALNLLNRGGARWNRTTAGRLAKRLEERGISEAIA
jgi:DNA invertase Pin-like site-specific DNA recombinase